MTGRLEIVGTPIGNLGDLSPRAVSSLEVADIILCEDTRRTRALLSAAGIPGGGRLRAFHDHNEDRLEDRIIEELRAGSVVALVSDAGMPAISDPGQGLVAAAASAGIQVTVVPGPSAVLAALVVSGLATERFALEGFLPRKGQARRHSLDLLVDEERTTVLFEAPQRLTALIGDLETRLGGERRVAIARELTKLHEEIWRGTLAQAVDHCNTVESRGEYVVVLEGAPRLDAPEVHDPEIEAHLRSSLAAGLSTRDAAQLAAQELGISRRRVYELATSLR